MNQEADARGAATVPPGPDSGPLSVSVPLQGGQLQMRGRDLLIMADGAADTPPCPVPSPPPCPAPLAAPLAAPVAMDTSIQWRLRVTCGRRVIALICHVRGLRWLRPRLMALRVEGKARRQHRLDLSPHPDGIALYSDGVLVEVAESPLHMAGLVYARLVELAMLPDAPLLVAHAAGLVVGGRSLLLAAASGVGKSCLATALSLRGATLLSDDTVGVAQGGDMFGLPVSLRLRPGGWALLRPLLLSAGLSEPAAGRSGIRSFAPQQVGSIAHRAGPPAAIIHLRRTAGRTPTLSRLTSAQGLIALAGAGATLAGRGDADAARRLAAWADATPFLLLDYDGLDGAAMALEALAAELPA